MGEERMVETKVSRIHIPTARKEGLISYRYEEWPDDIVYVGHEFKRSGYDLPETDWANPYYKLAKTDPERAVALYREYLLNSPALLARLEELRGKTLACWCKLGKPCHVDVLLELLEEMTQQDGTPQDAALRAEIFRYSMEHASPAIRDHIQHLCEEWIEYNDVYFGGALTEPFLAFEEPGFTTCYGEYSTVSAFGGSGQIMIRPSLLAGTLQDFRQGNRNKEGMRRFMDQVLLHEMIHQWQYEVNGTDLGEFHNYGGHGDTFSWKANEIGARLELSPVRLRNKKSHSRGTAHLPNPSQWPHNVTPVSYYLGAYVPASRDEEAKLREHLSIVLRRHGIEKVRHTTDEVWQAIEEAREAKRRLG
jgi:Domain of unknown function (DUF4326)